MAVPERAICLLYDDGEWTAMTADFVDFDKSPFGQGRTIAEALEQLKLHLTYTLRTTHAQDVALCALEDHA